MPIRDNENGAQVRCYIDDIGFVSGIDRVYEHIPNIPNYGTLEYCPDQYDLLKQEIQQLREEVEALRREIKERFDYERFIRGEHDSRFGNQIQEPQETTGADN